jgi:hypothetical protein
MKISKNLSILKRAARVVVGLPITFRIPVKPQALLWQSQRRSLGGTATVFAAKSDLKSSKQIEDYSKLHGSVW